MRTLFTISAAVKALTPVDGIGSRTMVGAVGWVILFLGGLGVPSQLVVDALADEDSPVEVQQATGEFAAPRDIEVSDPAPWPGLDADAVRMAEPTRLIEHEGPMSELGIGRSARELIDYDLRTRIERRSPASSSQVEGVRVTRSGNGEYGDATSDDAHKDMSGYAWIIDPTTGIRPRHVKLVMTFDRVDGLTATRGCSGTLIGPRHVLTAGHCVYTFTPTDDDVDLVPLADKVEAIPGWGGEYGPAGNAFATNIRLWSGWTDDEDSDHDVALITLDRPVGSLVGWRGVGASTNWDHYDQGLWESWTYPGTDFDEETDLSGELMYYQYGNYDYDDEPMYGVDRPGYHGTSGGGSIKDNAVWAVRTLLTKNAFGDVDTWDTAFGHSKLNDILNWMDTDRASGSDLFALDVQLSPDEALAGQTLANFSFLAHNSGQYDHTSGVSYTVYASTNSTISTSDTYVTSGYTPTNVPSLGSLRITVPSVVVPPQLSSGDYFFGVIITSADAIPGNNATGPQDVKRLTVTCNSTQSPPVPVIPENGHPCVNTATTMNWGSVPGIGVEYDLEWGKQPWAMWNNYRGSSTQYTVYGLDEGTTYYWRVRAILACGTATSFSEIFSFTTKGQLGDVARLDPADDTRCVGASVFLSWDPKPTAASYRVRWQEGPGSTNVAYYDTYNTLMIRTGLLPNTDYYWSIQAQDACGYFGPTNGRWKLSTAATSALAATQLEPVGGAFTGADVTLKLDYQPAGLDYEYELQTQSGTPVGTYTSEWSASVSNLPEGVYQWRGRIHTCTASGNVWGPWSGWETFEVDLTPPAFTGAPQPVNPPIGTWTNDDFVTVTFPEATDNCCVSEYWIAWDQDPNGVPDGSITSQTAGGWETNVPEGENWFHVVAVDGQGNVSPPQHLGPFLVDTTPPEIPAPEANIPSFTYVNATDIYVTWDEPADAASGVAGYSIEWTRFNNTVLDETIDTTERSSELLGALEGTNYFYIRSVDVAGNASDQLQVRYYIDRTPPEVEVQSPNGGEVLQHNQYYTIESYTQEGPGWISEVVRSYSVDGGATWYEIPCETGTPLQPCFGQPGGSGSLYQMQWRVPWVPPGSQVWLRAQYADLAGNVGEDISDSWFTIDTATSAEDVPSITEYSLQGNTPNPFNPTTTLRYALPEPASVRLDIFDLQGRLVRTLVAQDQPGPARYEVEWNGTDGQGRTVSSGVYVYLLRAGDFVESRRMTLLK